MAAALTFENFIDGQSREAGAYADIIEPATGQAYAQAPVSSAEEVEAALQAARRAFGAWKRTTPGERQAALLKIADALERRAEEFNQAECRDTGKPLAVTRTEELPLWIDHLRFFAGAARLLEGLASGEYLAGFNSAIRREPVGVCAQVAPWNYPLCMAIWKIGPALAAGNTVVLKPSESTPATTVKLAELAAEFLPPGVLNVVCGDRDTGRALVGSPIADMVSITGSERAGAEVAAAAAPGIKRVHLELGGKAPAVVLEDADLAAAATGIAAGAFFNAGQDCTAAARALVHESVAPEFTKLLVEAAAATRVGAPEEDVDFGAIASQAQLDKVLGFIDRLPGRARVLTGGRRIDRPGYFMAPTVVDGLRQDDEMVQQEVFGPVITVQTFSDDAAALAMANGVRYGLGSSVWTASHARALRFARDLDFGVVWINTHIPFLSEMPHGGFKHSGYGKDLSIYALEDYTRVKHVMSNLEGA
ncbi:MAG: aminobutyraldehyde dehydrogenase [Bifidobacteriaceae bacterium]|jgi:betaine-aldehyde dehydrogenase|nr:aminobutyraldehyde dehydrogenase [Bifidobacteriaceae bacterium]